MNTIDLKFKNINLSSDKQPMVSVNINGVVLTEDSVKREMNLNFQAEESNTLAIYFINKEDGDTITDSQGKIVDDMNFELDSVIIDGLDIKDLKWQGRYHTNGDVLPSCLFFGPKGHYELFFKYPVLKWTLEQNHLKNQNDPSWEEDYNYYMEAWKRLNLK